MKRIFAACVIASSFVCGLFADSVELEPNLERLEVIDQTIKAAIHENSLPGAAVLISSGGTIIKYDTYNSESLDTRPYSEDSLYRLFSMTKPITVVAALILHERGEFFLDDPIDTLWPAMADLQVYVSGEGDAVVTKPVERAPTVRELMMHTAGFYYAYSDHPAHIKLREIGIPSSGSTIAEASIRIASSPLLFEPGDRWNYGFSIDILAGLVEHVASESFDSFIQREILDPLKMLDTFYQVPPEKARRLLDLYNFDQEGVLMQIEAGETSEYLEYDRVTWGGTGLVGSAMDYWNFCRMLMLGGEFNGSRILSPASASYMLTNHFSKDKLPFEAPGSPYARFAKGYGFGFGVKVMLDPSENGNPVSVGEAGWSGAASTHFWLIPEHDLIVMFLTQNRGYLEIQPIAEKVKLSVYHSLEPVN